jgi:hypothetical protein
MGTYCNLIDALQHAGLKNIKAKPMLNLLVTGKGSSKIKKLSIIIITTI